MKAIAFDKDGVLLDSVREIFHESVAAYGNVEENEGNFNKFKFLYPFAKKAEDIYPIMVLIEDGKAENDAPELDGYDLEQANVFKDRFYAYRKRMVEADFEGWLRMITPFKFAIDAVHELSKKYDLFMSTNSDEFSTLKQVEKFGISIMHDSILSREASTDKADHMRIIATRNSIGLSDIIFIDNSIENLKSIGKLGCIVALASWGTNDWQVEAAKNTGINVLTEMRLAEQIEALI